MARRKRCAHTRTTAAVATDGATHSHDNNHLAQARATRRAAAAHVTDHETPAHSASCGLQSPALQAAGDQEGARANEAPQARAARAAATLRHALGHEEDGTSFFLVACARACVHALMTTRPSHTHVLTTAFCLFSLSSAAHAREPPSGSHRTRALVLCAPAGRSHHWRRSVAPHRVATVHRRARARADTAGASTGYEVVRAAARANPRHRERPRRAPCDARRVVVDGVVARTTGGASTGPCASQVRVVAPWYIT